MIFTTKYRRMQHAWSLTRQEVIENCPTCKTAVKKGYQWKPYKSLVEDIKIETRDGKVFVRYICDHCHEIPEDGLFETEKEAQVCADNMNKQASLLGM